MKRLKISPRVKLILRWTEHLLACMGLWFIAYFIGFDLSRMSTPSMSPTIRGTSFENGETVLSEKISFWFREPRRWEVILFRDAEGTAIMKRVVGLPGEKVALKDNQILINGSPIARPNHLTNLTYYSYGRVANGKEVPCDTGYFVLGDDSRDSLDSRYEGPVPPHRVKARAWMVVGPLRELRWVNR